jgi:hypothetical protein
MRFSLRDAEGDWALVTGASSGIGREFCRQLAAAGMNLVLTARRKNYLEALATELADRHGTRTLIVPLDLSVPGAAVKLKESTAAENIRIRLLVNNAACGPWGRFEKTTPAEYERLVQLIASATVSLSSHFLPDLKSFSSAAVINLSSPAALQPVCFKAVYSAAKMFVHNFSLALHGEWAQYGILVQTLVPGPTQSELDEKGNAYPCKLTERRDPPDGVVRISLAHLEKGSPLVTNAKGMYKQRLFAGIAPTRMIINVVKDMFRPPEERRKWSLSGGKNLV